MAAAERKVVVMGDYVCHSTSTPHINSRGIWKGDDPLLFSLPLLLLQLSLITLITRFIYLLLRPLGQPLIVSQIIGGVILGPSVLGHSPFSEKVFPYSGRTVLETLSVFGFMLFIFLVGVKIDPTMVIKSDRKAIAIGVLGILVPSAFSGLFAIIIRHSLPLDSDVRNALPFAVLVMSTTGFPVVACFLEELKILNSDIGRLASSSSAISDLCQWSVVSVVLLVAESARVSFKSVIGTLSSGCLLVLVIVFGFRPTALWAIKHMPEGKPVKDIYIFAVFVTLLGCGFVGESFGLGSMLASFILGLVIPDGPPLAAALVERLDCFVSVLLMPLFFTVCGLQMDVYAIKKFETFIVLQLVGIFSFVGKIIGTLLPPLFYRMPLRDSISLALIMNSKGIVELAMLLSWKQTKVINEDCFAIMIISVVVVTGVISPIVKALYDPSRRFVAYRRRTIQHNRGNEEFRVLGCIHSTYNVWAMENLLQASNPTRDSPIHLVVLHLIKLEGRASSLLVAHRPREKPSLNPTESERIFSAFRRFEQKQQQCSLAVLHCYKGISPYDTMHNDVCSLALEKRICLIIIPFHKQWIDPDKEKPSQVFRHVNKNVFDKAPCSVGVLIDCSNRRRPRSASVEPPLHRVMAVFFGGADDREALAYARRMSENTGVTLTLLLFTSTTQIVRGTVRSTTLDNEILGEFRESAQSNDRVECQEEVVTDAVGILSTIRSMESRYDLILVGRRHGQSQMLSQLTKRNDTQELGAIGGIFAASNFRGEASVLVVQQQRRVWGLHDPEESTHLRRLKT